MRGLRAPRVRGFAARIADRHTTAVGMGWLRASMLLLQRCVLHLARLRLLRQTIHPTWSLHAGPVTMSFAPAERALVRIAAVRGEPTTVRATGVAAWVERRVRGQGRSAASEGTPVATATIARTAPTAGHTAPVAMVVRHRAPDEIDPARSSGPTVPRGTGTDASPGVKAAPVLPVGELDRVTDHVLRTLDRRMSASRERRGKV